MKVYLPSWNGDFKLESTGGGAGSVFFRPAAAGI